MSTIKRKMRKHPTKFLPSLSLLFLLVAAGFIIPSYANLDSNSHSVVATPSSEDKQARIEYVRNILSQRLDYVKSKKRMVDFHRWIMERGGEAKIFSMHGIDVNFEMDELDNIDMELSVVPVSRQNKNDPFLADRMSLALANNTDHKYNKGDRRELDNKPPTALQLYFRAVKLSLVFAPVVTTGGLAILSKKFRCGVWYRWVASCLASGGAAFIKWGQWAATRTDMFPIALCNALSELHNSAPSHSWEFTQSQVESSLDIPEGSLFDVFESFDTEPLGSGSIAQVHCARLRSGEAVAAKVRHPRVAKLIDMDFRLMEMLAGFCDKLPGLRWLHMKDSVSQFSHTMAAQAHLNVEAHHLEVLNHNFRRWDECRFPSPFYASSSLILETFEEGKIVTGLIDAYDAEAMNMSPPRNGYDIVPIDIAKFLVTTGVSLYLKMLFVDNLMHADLHPGNIMIEKVSTDANGRPRYRITLVDAGMVAQLDDEESSTFIGLLTSVGEGDAKSAAEFAMRFSIENDMDDNEKEAFTKEMEELFSEKCRGYGTNTDVGEVLRSVLGLIRDHHVRIDANYATLVINVLCVESIGRRLCPSYNVLDASRPLLQAYRKLCFEEDGVTPVKNTEAIRKRLKRLMPLLLFGTKRNSDASVFKKIETERREAVTMGSSSPSLSKLGAIITAPALSVGAAILATSIYTRSKESVEKI